MDLNLDLNLARSIITLLAFISFISIVVWAYHRGSRARFEAAAQLPFQDERATDDGVQQ
jgi:cytochrome c oxidase cbb3-type subunit 4